jgi:hypothetical protein
MRFPRRRAGAGAAAALALSLAAAAAGSAPTYLVEWVSRTGDAMQRVTLFSDGVLVRKSRAADGKIEMKKRKLASSEYDSYVALFRAPEAPEAAGVFESGMSGGGVVHSVITVTNLDGGTWTLTFDSFAGMTPQAYRLRTALEDLRDSFGRLTASSGDFPVEKLVPGAILHKRDGKEFRIIRFDEHAGVLEVRGLDEPYSQFFKLESLPQTFLPP